MRFQSIYLELKNWTIFNLNDIKKIDPNFQRRQLFTWQKNGLIKAIVSGYYTLIDTNINEALLFMVANKLYEPSYISLESAFEYYHVIPETVLGVTSISSRKTNLFESKWGGFSYRSIKPLYMFGYEIIEVSQNEKYLMASLEKAVLDYLYLNSNLNLTEDFEGLRWNRDELIPVVNNSRFNNYLSVFNKLALKKRVDLLKRYLDA